MGAAEDTGWDSQYYDEPVRDETPPTPTPRNTPDLYFRTVRDPEHSTMWYILHPEIGIMWISTEHDSFAVDNEGDDWKSVVAGDPNDPAQTITIPRCAVWLYLTANPYATENDPAAPPTQHSTVTADSVILDDWSPHTSSTEN